MPDLSTMYQGNTFKIHNLQNYSIDPEEDSLTHTGTTNVSSDLVYLQFDDVNSIMNIRVSPHLNEPFSIDVTASDPFGNSYIQSMDIHGVTACPQQNCNAWRGIGARDCIGWQVGFLPNNGVCVTAPEVISNGGSEGDNSGDTSGEDNSGDDTNAGDNSGGDTSGGNSSGGNNSGDNSSGGDNSDNNGSSNGGSSNGETSSGSDPSENSNEDNPSPEPATKDYLNRNVTVNENTEIGVGASVAVSTVTVSSVSVVGGSASASAGAGVSQCQAAQFMCLFNMDIPDEYIEYWKSLSSTQLNFEFVDSMGLADSMEDEYSGRYLASKGYKNLSNIGLKHASFLVTFIFFFIFLLLIVIFHILVILLDKITNQGEESVNCLKTLRGYLEFGLYFYIIVFASPFMFLVSLNEIATFEIGSGFKAASYVFSMLSFLLLIVY